MPKFTVMIKMPDAGSDSIKQALEDGVLKPEHVEAAKAVCKKFLEYDEYAYIVMDTDKQTATVQRSSPH